MDIVEKLIALINAGDYGTDFQKQIDKLMVDGSQREYFCVQINSMSEARKFHALSEINGYMSKKIYEVALSTKKFSKEDKEMLNGYYASFAIQLMLTPSQRNSTIDILRRVSYCDDKEKSDYFFDKYVATLKDAVRTTIKPVTDGHIYSPQGDDERLKLADSIIYRALLDERLCDSFLLFVQTLNGFLSKSGIDLAKFKSLDRCASWLLDKGDTLSFYDQIFLTKYFESVINSTGNDALINIDSLSRAVNMMLSGRKLPDGIEESLRPRVEAAKNNIEIKQEEKDKFLRTVDEFCKVAGNKNKLFDLIIHNFNIIRECEGFIKKAKIKYGCIPKEYCDAVMRMLSVGKRSAPIEDEKLVSRVLEDFARNQAVASGVEDYVFYVAPNEVLNDTFNGITVGDTLPMKKEIRFSKRIVDLAIAGENTYLNTIFHEGRHAKQKLNLLGMNYWAYQMIKEKIIRTSYPEFYMENYIGMQDEIDARIVANAQMQEYVDSNGLDDNEIISGVRKREIIDDVRLRKKADSKSFGRSMISVNEMICMMVSINPTIIQTFPELSVEYKENGGTKATLELLKEFEEKLPYGKHISNEARKERANICHLYGNILLRDRNIGSLLGIKTEIKSVLSERPQSRIVRAYRNAYLRRCIIAQIGECEKRLQSFRAEAQIQEIQKMLVELHSNPECTEDREIIDEMLSTISKKQEKTMLKKSGALGRFFGKKDFEKIAMSVEKTKEDQTLRILIPKVEIKKERLTEERER